MTRYTTLLLGAALVAATPTATLAHGKKVEADDGHASAGVVREQKPWGIGASGDEASRTVEVSMKDTMRFIPSSFSVEKGETVKFLLTNEGQTQHEFVLGTKTSNDEHAAMMVKFPGMEHDEPYMAHVAPGETGEITWTFNEAGSFAFACLIAGHYQAGMVGDVSVTGS